MSAQETVQSSKCSKIEQILCKSESIPGKTQKKHVGFVNNLPNSWYVKCCKKDQNYADIVRLSELFRACERFLNKSELVYDPPKVTFIRDKPPKGCAFEIEFLKNGEQLIKEYIKIPPAKMFNKLVTSVRGGYCSDSDVYRKPSPPNVPMNIIPRYQAIKNGIFCFVPLVDRRQYESDTNVVYRANYPKRLSDQSPMDNYCYVARYYSKNFNRVNPSKLRYLKFHPIESQEVDLWPARSNKDRLRFLLAKRLRFSNCSNAGNQKAEICKRSVSFNEWCKNSKHFLKMREIQEYHPTVAYIRNGNPQNYSFIIEFLKNGDQLVWEYVKPNVFIMDHAENIEDFADLNNQDPKNILLEDQIATKESNIEISQGSDGFLSIPNTTEVIQFTNESDSGKANASENIANNSLKSGVQLIPDNMKNADPNPSTSVGLNGSRGNGSAETEAGSSYPPLHFFGTRFYTEMYIPKTSAQIPSESSNARKSIPMLRSIPKAKKPTSSKYVRDDSDSDSFNDMFSGDSSFFDTDSD